MKEEKLSWEEKFDKKFTRKSKGLEDKGKFREDWFIKEVQSKEIKDFICKIITQSRFADIKSEIERLKGMEETYY